MLPELEDSNQEPPEQDHDKAIRELINSLPDDKQLIAMDYLRRIANK